jgi:hypothetical protein
MDNGLVFSKGMKTDQVASPDRPAAIWTNLQKIRFLKDRVHAGPGIDHRDSAGSKDPVYVVPGRPGSPDLTGTRIMYRMPGFQHTFNLGPEMTGQADPEDVYRYRPDKGSDGRQFAGTETR